MDNKEIKKLLKDIDNSIERIDKKQNKLMFFVADSKGTPIGSLSYIYDLAYKLQEMGYNVQMLYAEKDFTGVASWMGEKYSNLPHYNVGKDIVDVNPSDVVFIPELYSSVMTKTKELKCKKVAILTNFDYMTDLIPYGATWMSMGIYDCITTTNALKERLNEVFPQVRTRVIRPVIAPLFQPNPNQQLIVNIVTKDENVISSIVKPFKWRFPHLGFVTFRAIVNKPKEEFAKYVAEGSVTVWIDPATDFGYSALEAMATNNIIIGKIPENIPEWMLDKEGLLKNNGIWFYRLRDLPAVLNEVITTLLYNEIPDELYDAMKETVEEYTDEKQKGELTKVIEEDIMQSHRSEMVLLKDAYKNKLNDENTAE